MVGKMAAGGVNAIMDHRSTGYAPELQKQSSLYPTTPIAWFASIKIAEEMVC